MHHITLRLARGEKTRETWVDDGHVLLPPDFAKMTGTIGLLLLANRALAIAEDSLVPLRPNRRYPPRSTKTTAAAAAIIWRPGPTAPSLATPETFMTESPTRTACGEAPRAAYIPCIVDSQGVRRSWPAHGVHLIGRHAACTVRIDDPLASSFHCALQRHTNGISVVDLRSKNGTWMNGERVYHRTTTRHATLRFGNSRILIRTESTGHNPIIALPSQSMRRLYGLVDRVAASDAPVLIHGESGSGKEAIVRRLHRASGRGGRLVVINAATLSTQLAGSLLFGHVAGAFTGAARDRSGAFVEADGGTLFLDEIAELSPSVQAELLRAVEAHEVRPVGSTRALPVTVRLVSASHQDLAEAARNGTFREDLYHRISVLPLSVPSLRDRPTDIKAITKHYLRVQVPPRKLSQKAKAKLLAHSWPGNIRELINVLKHACVMTDEVSISAEDIVMAKPTSATGDLDNILRERIISAYGTTGGSVAATARDLGLHRSTVYRFIKRSRAQRSRHGPES